jgi:hypothetical protein
MLDTVEYAGQRHIPIGSYAYLAKKDNNEHTLIWGAAIEINKETILIDNNLWDYIDPCPNRCPDKNGF